jgi:hypothetical protein
MHNNIGALFVYKNIHLIGIKFRKETDAEFLKVQTN